MTAPPKRIRIGRNNDVATRQVVYRTPQGIEVDELDHFEIIRKRVFYDDVQLVTYHRQRGWGLIVVLAIFLVGSTIAAVASSSVPVLAAIMAGLAAIFLILLAARLLFQVDIITVFGRRSKAAVRFAYRKAHARRLYGEICASVAAAQRKLAREIAATEPPEERAAVGEMPPEPEEAVEPTISAPPPAQ